VSIIAFSLGVSGPSLLHHDMELLLPIDPTFVGTFYTALELLKQPAT